MIGGLILAAGLSTRMGAFKPLLEVGGVPALARAVRCLKGTAEEIAVNKHLLLQGAEPDTDRAQALVLDDFKNGRLGRITLDLSQNA